MKRFIPLSLLVCTAALAQNAALLPMPRITFTDANNAPLAGGFLRTCVAGTACSALHAWSTPSNPLATYTDSTAGTPNANPIVLDSAGSASIWLGADTYKLVLTDATGVVIWTQDGVSATSMKAIQTTTGAVSNFSVPGTLTAGSATVTNNATVGGTLGVTGAATFSGNVTFKGPNPYLDVTAYGATLNGSSDDTTAIQAALTAASGKAQTVYVPCSANNTAVISSTLTIPSGVHFSTCIGGMNQAQAGKSGIKLKWTGSTSLPMLKAFDVNHSSIEGFTLDCNSVSGCIGIQYASDNAPSSSYFEVLHTTVLNAHQAMVVGDPSNSAANCVSTPNGLGCAQADSATIEDFNVAGNGTDLTAEALHINDTNGLQSSEIRLGNFQYVNYGVRIVASNGNILIKALNGANPVGAAKTFIQLDSSLAVAPALVANETEGSWTYAVHDSSVNASYQYQSVWINNAWNNPVLCDGGDHILSLGNNGGNHSTIAWTAAGTCIVNSLMDNTENSTTMSAWVSSGSGAVNSIGSINSAGGVISQGPMGASYNGTLASVTKGNLSTASSATAGAMFLGGDGNCFISRSSGTLNLNCGNGATINLPGTGTALTVPIVTVGGGANIVLRCTTAGTLPIGALTIAAGNCGASTDTGVRVP